MTNSVLILGGGYVGQRLANQLNAPCTHRNAKDCDDQKSFCFDLRDNTTWKNIPTAETVIWTFPAVPLDQVQAFYQAHLSKCKNLIVFASTSCYQTIGEDDLVTENSPLDLTRERVVGEEWLREQGATVLVLAGIYGPDREPRNWLAHGRITTPEKRVNLIHVDDIVKITEQLLASDQNIRSERFNLADGEALHWKTISDHYQIPITPSDKTFESKRVCNKKISERLGGFQFRSLMG